MFANANNVIIQNGSFNNVQGGGLNGLDIFLRHVSPDALHDSLKETNAPKCHPNTRTAVLKDILSWVEDDNSETQVLWLHGPAGAGKTAIGHTVVEKSQEKKRFAAGFFFSRTEAGRNDDKCLIATISYQLLHSIPEARSFIEAAATKDPLIFMRSLKYQIEQLIVDPLKQMRAGTQNLSLPRLILIDGLDECLPKSSQRNILMAIHTAFGQDCFPFRVLICSRAELNIREVFDSELADLTHRISLDDKYNPDQDITLYLRSSFSEIGRKHRQNRGAMCSYPPPSWPSEKAIQTLVSKASGQFIYAATVIRYIDVHHGRPDERLKVVLGLLESQSSKPFSELDKLYQEIFSVVEDMSLTSRLLGTILILKKPLSIGSLENLLGLQPGDAGPALCYLHSVVRIPNDTDGHAVVGLYHATLGDFLFDSARAGVYHITMESAHATLAESCLRILSDQLIPMSASIPRDMIMTGLRDPAAEYAWHNWIYHFLNSSTWNDNVVQGFRNLPSWFFKVWLNPRSTHEVLRLTDVRHNIDQFDKLKSWFVGQDSNRKRDGLELATRCGKILELYFKDAWAHILGESPQNVSLSLGILAVVLSHSSISSAALATLFKLNWVGFVQATYLIRPYINFGTSVNVACNAFWDFISNPNHVSRFYFNPNTPNIHADLVIRFVECISSHPSQDKQRWQLDPDGAYNYSEANWENYLSLASSRRLLDYAYTVIRRLGHRPICTHENPCDLLCEVDKTVRCIESAIIVASFFPCTPRTTSTSDIKLLKLLKDIITIKYLRTPSFTKVHSGFQEWSSKHRLAMARAQVHLSPSSATRDSVDSEFISFSTESSPSTVHQNYQHLSSSQTQVDLDSTSAIRGSVSKLISSLTARISSVVHQDNQSSRTSQVDVVSSVATRSTGQSEIVLSLEPSNSSTVHQEHQHTLSSRTSQVDLGSSSSAKVTGPSEIIPSSGVSNSSTAHQDSQHLLSSQTSAVDVRSFSATRSSLSTTRSMGPSEIVPSLGASNSSALYQDVSSLGTSNSSVVYQDNQHTSSSRTSQVYLGSASAPRDKDLSESISSFGTSSSSTVQDDQHALSSQNPQVDLGSSSPITGMVHGRFENVLSSGASNSLVVRQDNQQTLSSRTFQVDLGSSAATKETGSSETVSSSAPSNSLTVRQDNQHRLTTRTSRAHLASSNATKGMDHSEIVLSSGPSNSATVHDLDNQCASPLQTQAYLDSSSASRDKIVSSLEASNSSVVHPHTLSSGTSQVVLGSCSAIRGTGPSEIIPSSGVEVVHDNLHASSLRTSQVDLDSSSTAEATSHIEIVSCLEASNSSVLRPDNSHAISSEISQVDNGSSTIRVTGLSKLVWFSTASNTSSVPQHLSSAQTSQASSAIRATGPADSSVGERTLSEHARTPQVNPDSSSTTGDTDHPEIVLYLGKGSPSVVRHHQDNPHALSSRTSQVDLGFSNIRVTGLPEVVIVSSSGASSSAVHQDDQDSSSSRPSQVDPSSAIRGGKSSFEIVSSVRASSLLENQHALRSRASQVDLGSSSATRDTDHCDIVLFLRPSNNSSVIHQDNVLPSRTSQFDLGSSSAISATGVSNISSLTVVDNLSAVYRDTQHTLSSRTSQVDLGSSTSSVTRVTDDSEIVLFLGASNSSVVQDNRHALFSRVDLVPSSVIGDADHSETVLFSGARSSLAVQQDSQHVLSSRTSQVDLGSSSATRDKVPSEIVPSSGANKLSVIYQANQHSQTSQVGLGASSDTRHAGPSENNPTLGANSSLVVVKDNQHALLSRTSHVALVASSSVTRDRLHSETAVFLGANNSLVVHEDNQHRTSQADVDSSRGSSTLPPSSE